MMYNDEEYKNLIARLAESDESFEQDGYTVRIKRIPDVDRHGDIDPRVAVLNRKLNADPGPDRIDLSNMAPLRACMNWKSLDITRMLINVQHSSFTGREGNRIRLRVYSPAELTELEPCIVYFHGGGWIGGEMAYVENACKLLAERAGAVVVSVDYRLAPENPFPAGFNDCFDAVCHVYNNNTEFQIDPHKIAVSGDSAGANLAAACAICDRDKGKGMIRYQALAYPCVNPFSLPSEYYTWSYEQYEVLHNKEDIDACIFELPVRRCLDVVEEAYIQGLSDPKHPYASPIFAGDLKGVAPALIVTPEYDHLRLEGEAYAKRLAADGVNVQVLRYCGINHGFMEKVGQYPQAEDCLNEMAKGFLRAIET